MRDLRGKAVPNSENRGLKYCVEILKEPNDVCECIMALLLLSFNVTVEKKDQTILAILGKLVKKAIETPISTGFSQSQLH